MAEIMTVWSWSLTDFDKVETVEDLLDWHSRAIALFNRVNHLKGGAA